MPTEHAVSSGPQRKTKLILAGAIVVAALVVGFLFLRSQAATVKPGDVNGDGVVTQDDIAQISKNINKKNMTQADGDMDGDGDIDIMDVSLATKNIEN